MTFPRRVVFDTNIWISGLIWRGDPYRCLKLAYAGLVRPLYCTLMLAELTQKLRSSFSFSENHIEAVAYDYKRLGDLIKINGDLRVVKDDHDDDKFIECALTGNASVVVSGDNHLVNLGAYGKVHIMT